MCMQCRLIFFTWQRNAAEWATSTQTPVAAAAQEKAPSTHKAAVGSSGSTSHQSACSCPSVRQSANPRDRAQCGSTGFGSVPLSTHFSFCHPAPFPFSVTWLARCPVDHLAPLKHASQPAPGGPERVSCKPAPDPRFCNSFRCDPPRLPLYASHSIPTRFELGRPAARREEEPLAYHPLTRGGQHRVALSHLVR